VTFNAKFRRRLFGSLCLSAAVGMLVVGETNPAPDASRGAFVGYWLACFGFAMFAMAAALMDLRAVRREARTGQRNLLEDALHEIEAEKRRRQAGAGRNDAAELKD
jgi:hypothetical protein